MGVGTWYLLFQGKCRDQQLTIARIVRLQFTASSLRQHTSANNNFYININSTGSLPLPPYTLDLPLNPTPPKCLLDPPQHISYAYHLSTHRPAHTWQKAWAPSPRTSQARLAMAYHQTPSGRWGLCTSPSASSVVPMTSVSTVRWIC